MASVPPPGLDSTILTAQALAGDPASSFVRFRARLAKFNCESLCSVHYQLRCSAREFQYADACPHSVSHSQNVSAFSEELHHHLKALHVALLDHVLVYQHIYSNFGFSDKMFPS